MRILIPFMLMGASVSAFAQIPTTSIGGCLTISLRVGAQPPPSLYSFCAYRPASVAPGQPFQKTYGWVPPILASAFDAAETAFCGSTACATGQSSARITVYVDGIPQAAVKRQGGAIDIFLSTGLIDFIDGTGRGFLLDAEAMRTQGKAPDGYRAWLERMRAGGGGTCTFTGHRGPAGGAFANSQEWLKNQVPAITVYEFILGHELAHATTAGGKCGYSGSDPLSLEVACDETAFRRLSTAKTADGKRFPAYHPSLTIYFLVAMRYYERLVGPHLASFYRKPGDPADLEPMFYVRDWKARARVLADDWRSFCGKNGSDTMCKYWEDLVADAGTYVESQPPVPCKEEPSAR